MKRTSFGSGEDVLEEMFATWEPFLSKAIELLSIEGLAKVCAIHAAVEKVGYCLVLNRYFRKTKFHKTMVQEKILYHEIDCFIGSKTSPTDHFAPT